MVEMELVGVRVELPSNAPIVLLKEQTGAGRLLPIFIGGPEANAIALALDEVETPRPMTHDLFKAVLDELGVDYIEGGWPGANPTDDSFFDAPPELNKAKLVAFGMTRRPGRSVENDPGLAPLVGSKAGAICLVGKSWDFHVDVALEIPREENVAMIADSRSAPPRADYIQYNYPWSRP